MTYRKKHGAALWATVGLLQPVLYVLSFGPACWLTSQVDGGGWKVPNPALRIYWPFGEISRKEHTDSRCGHWLRWWMTVGLMDGRCRITGSCCREIRRAGDTESVQKRTENVEM